MISVRLNVNEEEQQSSFQNSTLHTVNDNIACSIAAYPKYPDGVLSQEEAVVYLREQLHALSKAGWEFEIQIGRSETALTE